MKKPTPNQLIAAIREGVIQQPTSKGPGDDHIERPGGAYLFNLPGLTEQRLGELYSGILLATGDPHATGAVKYRAIGGIEIVVKWTQNGLLQMYGDEITPEQHAKALNETDDEMFTRFATRVLEAVRVNVEKAKTEHDANRQPTITERIKGAADAAVALAAGLVRKPVAGSQSEGVDIDAIHKRPSEHIPEIAKQARVYVYEGQQWVATDEIVDANAWLKGVQKIKAQDLIEPSGTAFRIWMPVGAIIKGTRAYRDIDPNPPATAQLEE